MPLACHVPRVRSERIAVYRTVRSAEIDDWMRGFVWTAVHSTYQGVFDMCAYHEAYCTGEYRQYDNFTSCLAYMTAVPDVSVD